MDVVWEHREAIALAFAYTVLLFLIAGVGSTILGTLLAGMRVGPIPVLRWAGAGYVTLVRNTPLVIVIIFFRYAAPKIDLKFNFIDVVIPTGAGDIRLNNIFAACTVGLTMYTAAFVCEALRSGINAVPLGQAEAARAVGMPFGGVMRHVVLPQAFRASIPPLANVQIALIKNTTVAGALGVAEAFVRMRGLINIDATARIPIFIAFAAIFVVLVEIISFAAHRLERRVRVA
ncbi:amino acid ABC transporter permease [Nocardioides immobilis]|uniref:Amino acid ABC transporter permease n=1 Tax=Nocardioides immobilis TaxID=2049295 RepID=A0A417XWW3_9ACTN|nr:amino acid ABC transporter permease [Nocardioides immobilis]RHW24805.1 amino acid ABC transporter permease [Nocardioides immobilis]